MRLLEARGVVVGRARRLEIGGVPFEAGCEALDEAHERLVALAAEVGLVVRDGAAWLGELEPELDGDELALFRALDAELDALAGRVDPGRPEGTDGAAELDATSLADWLSRRGASDAVLEAAETWHCVASAGVALTETSLLAQAAKAAAGAAPNGLRLRFEGGPSALANRLAEGLDGRIRAGAETVAIEEDSAGVSVLLADGTRERGVRAVVAVPLTAQRGIRFDPPLPAHRRLALARARYGDVVKAGLAYEGPPTGKRPTLTRDGLVYEPDHELPLVGVFAGGRAARRLDVLPLRERDTELVRLAGETPRAVGAVAWSREPFAHGSYVIFGPRDLTEWGARLAEPHGRVHFAGSESSPLPSYMEGAVRAGERAAAEILATG